MDNLKIIWWVIVIGILIYVIHEFGFAKSENKCCRVVPPIEVMDAATTIYCKRDGKYYVTVTGGLVGGETETEISEQDYNMALQKFTCK